jgi:hypothetical protein
MEHAALDPVQHCVIRCCTCGDAVLADNVVRGMCLDCLKTESDVTAGISREATVNQCRGCERFGTEKKHQVRVLSGVGVRGWSLAWVVVEEKRGNAPSSSTFVGVWVCVGSQRVADEFT